MLNWLRSRSLSARTAAGLYGSIVAQARNEAFYAAGGVPDTMEGRFGMIGVHIFLVLERIRRQGDPGKAIGRALLERFMTDLDNSMREIGIGDLGVPKRVKKAAAALLEHLEAYRTAFATPNSPALADALARYVYLGDGKGSPVALASYMQEAARHLDQQSWGRLAAGEVTFPNFGT